VRVRFDCLIPVCIVFPYLEKTGILVDDGVGYLAVLVWNPRACSTELVACIICVTRRGVKDDRRICAPPVDFSTSVYPRMGDGEAV
jgi:hypothetical protein